MQSQLIPDKRKRCNLKTLLRSSKSLPTWFMWAASERGWSGLGFGCWAGVRGRALFWLCQWRPWANYFIFPIFNSIKSILIFPSLGQRKSSHTEEEEEEEGGSGFPSRGGEGVERWSSPALALPGRRRLCQPQLFGTNRHSHLQVQRRVRVATGHW